MIDFEKEMARILSDDPLGLLEVKSKTSHVISADDRLLSSFEEINVFVKANGDEPKSGKDIGERKLASRLKGIRSSPEKIAALLEYDILSLLREAKPSVPPDIGTVDDILNDDALGLLGDEGPEQTSIFHLKNVRKTSAQSEENARRKPCKEFSQFEPIFKHAQDGLASKKRKIIPFKSESQIELDTVFVVQGMLVHVANIGNKKRKNFGNFNARLYCVFENGTESHMLLRSLAASLWKDENSGQIVDSTDKELFAPSQKITSDDKVTGYIYILKSLSNDPKIKEIPDLFKIGFSTTPVAQRIENAEKDPTYLMAGVKVVSQFETYNISPQKFEGLLHRFFAAACLNLDVFDKAGKRCAPREWFVVPFNTIETAVNLLITGEIIHYSYDVEKQSIFAKEEKTDL